jgi:hypothetical protein
VDRVRHTSIDAYNAIQANGILTGLRWEVYDLLYKHGPLTQGEVAQRSSRKHNPHSISPRFAELERAGAIRVVGTRRCVVTFVQCHVWDVTSDVPVVIKKTTKKLKDWAAKEALEKIACTSNEVVIRRLAMDALEVLR